MDFDLVLFLITFTKKEDADTNGSHITNHKLCVATGRFIPPPPQTQMLVAEPQLWEMEGGSLGHRGV